MISTIKAEFLKLLTVRSTYFTVLTALVIVALAAGFGDGYRMTTQGLHNSGALANESANAIIFGGIILALVGLLLLAHEYRYNTILYTLTSSNSRVKSLLSKFVAVTVFAVIVTVLVALFSPLCTIIGVHLAGKHLGPQIFPIWHVLWQCVFVGWGYAMYALVLTAILRSQVGSIMSFLLIPLVGENIIMGIFKNSGKYLPFTSLQAVVNSLLPKGDTTPISTAHGVTVACIYIAAGLLASLILFVRRDAN